MTLDDSAEKSIPFGREEVPSKKPFFLTYSGAFRNAVIGEEAQGAGVTLSQRLQVVQMSYTPLHRGVNPGPPPGTSRSVAYRTRGVDPPPPVQQICNLRPPLVGPPVNGRKQIGLSNYLKFTSQ